MRLTAADLASLGYSPTGQRLKAVQSGTGGSDSEAELHRAILDHCRARGWPVVHARMDRPATVGVGTPDFVVALPGGRTVWAEAKAAKGKLTTAQSAWLAYLRGCGHVAGVVRSIDDFVALCGAAVGSVNGGQHKATQYAKGDSADVEELSQ